VGDVHIALNGAVAVRKRFTERDRAAHRQEGNGVDAHPPSSQIADDGYGKGDYPGNRGRGPDPVRGGLTPSRTAAVPDAFQRRCRSRRFSFPGLTTDRRARS
jgi:hypothetical protein